MEKKISNGFFVFTKKERRGIAVILGGIAIMITAQYVYPFIIKDVPKPVPDLAEKIEALRKNDSADKLKSNYVDYADDENRSNKLYARKGNFSGNMFYFNPNTISSDDWMKLGASEKTAAGILKYISKGGKFRSADDISKIWGLSEETKKRMIPFVRIPQPDDNFSQKRFEKQFDSFPRYTKKNYEKNIPQSVDLNSTDSAGLDALPGIGPGYAKRIISFREKLGGFVNVDQVAETFGLPDSTFQKIKSFLNVSPNDIKKININSASLDELKVHPYIRWQMAKVILEYRKQHGGFRNESDLKKIMIINEEMLRKIGPYLSY